MKEPVKIAVFGGRDSCAPTAKCAKEIWNREMPCVCDDYGFAGAGFVAGREDRRDIPSQVKRAFESGKTYDMYVFWCSDADSASEENLVEIDQAIRKAIKLIRLGNPRGQVILFTTTRQPLKTDSGSSIAALAEIQANVASELSVSVMDFNRFIAFPSENTEKYFEPDGVGLSAEGMAFIGYYQAGYIRYIRSVGWGVDPEYIKVEDVAVVERRTRRLHDAKWGVFNHYLGHDITSADAWNAKVNSFDVKKVADQLEACGAKFYFITLMQGRRWMCAPNATYDRIAGTKPGEACSIRDLPMELSEELMKRGIDLYLYYTGDGPYLDNEIGSRFGFTEPRFLGVTRSFVNKWSSVLEEFAVRYGDRVKGWWIDGCYDNYLRYTDDLLEPYARAVHKGNPDAAVALNNGVVDYYRRYSRHADFTAGEFNDFYCIPKTRFIEGAQSFALIPLGAWGKGGNPAWASGGCKRDAKYVADYVRLVNANGGSVAIDVHVAPDGSWDQDQFEVLKTVGLVGELVS